MRLLIMSDIHGNLNALKAVLNSCGDEIDACVLLGDLIDYGPHSNEVIAILKNIPYPVVCNIWGNHEYAIVNNNYTYFSTPRGEACAKYTRGILDNVSWEYIKNVMIHKGRFEFCLSGKRCLAIHGSLKDEYWNSLNCEQELSEYCGYDYVFSGHSHLPHYFERFCADDISKRFSKKTIFINPGSVGQPRNLNSSAQYAVLNIDTEEICLRKVPYDIAKEQLGFSHNVDKFYKERLGLGI